MFCDGHFLQSIFLSNQYTIWFFNNIVRGPWGGPLYLKGIKKVVLVPLREFSLKKVHSSSFCVPCKIIELKKYLIEVLF